MLDVQHNIYNRENIGFSSLSHLESRGLIQFGNLAGFVRLKLPKTVTVSYFSRIVTLTFQLEADNPLEIGKVRFTRAGDELSRICGAEPVEGFFEYVYDVWAAKTLVPKRDIEQDAPGSAPKVGQL